MVGLGSLSGGGHYWALGFLGEEAGVAVAPLGAVAPLLLSPALSFHVIPLSLFTFWPLSKSTLLGLYRKVVGLISVLHENRNCLQGLNDQSSEKSVLVVSKKCY